MPPEQVPDAQRIELEKLNGQECPQEFLEGKQFKCLAILDEK